MNLGERPLSNLSPSSVLRSTAGSSSTVKATLTSKPRGEVFRSAYGKPFMDPRYEMINRKIQRRGEVALLTFNLVNYGKRSDGPERVLSRWNSTEVYSRIGGTWKITAIGRSVQPEIKQPGS